MIAAGEAVGAVVAALLPDGGRRPYTAEEQAAIADVLDAAAEWDAGRLPLGAFREIGTVAPPAWTDKTLTCRGRDRGGYSRWLALVWARAAGDERLGALRRALEAIR